MRERSVSVSYKSRSGKFGVIETASLDFLYEKMCRSCGFKPFDFAPDQFG
jgi:hypothetical protein